MRTLLSPTGLIRPFGFLCLALTALAVALGHGMGDPGKDRLLAPVRHHVINGYHFFDGDPTPRLLDAETGTMTRLAIDLRGRMEHASLSSWRDGLGQARIVGLWEETQGIISGPTSRSLGIARYTYPAGHLIDNVPLEEVIPTSVPCWYPGMSSRILFAAADGMLYRFSFDEDERHSGLGDDIRRPRPLEWQAAAPGNAGLHLYDAIWPNEPGFAQTLIVSLTFLEPEAAVPTKSHAQLWWLRLNAEGTAIEAAGRLMAEGTDEIERWPALTTVPGVGLTLAYFARPRSGHRWQLRLARVALAPRTGVPHAEATRAVGTDADYVRTAPVFSYDGRWLNVVVRASKKITRVDRLRTTSLLPEPATATAVADATDAAPL